MVDGSCAIVALVGLDPWEVRGLSWLKQAYTLFEAMDRHKRDLERKDLELRLGMTPDMATKVLLRLVRFGCIKRSHGSTRTGVYYEFLSGSTLPEDGRINNKPPRKALTRRASRPTTDVSRWKKIEE